MTEALALRRSSVLFPNRRVRSYPSDSRTLDLPTRGPCDTNVQLLGLLDQRARSGKTD